MTLTILSVYILVKDGRLIFTRSFGGFEKDPDLVGGMLSALNTIALDWVGGGLQSFKAGEGRTFFAEDFGELIVVILALDPVAGVDVALDRIGLRFLSDHGSEVTSWDGDLRSFSNFEGTLQEIFDDMGFEAFEKEEPTKVLDSLSILTLDDERQRTAMAILTLREATAKEVSKETGRSENDEEAILTNLIEDGYVGFRKKGEEGLYYLNL